MFSKVPEKLLVFIGDKTQKGSIYAPIESRQVWKREANKA